MNAKHEWKFDLPWHMVDLKDWFYMVNTGYIHPIYFLHVRILGVRSLWMIELPVGVGNRDTDQLDMLRIEAAFHNFRGAGDRRCECHSTILKMYGCQCGKQDQLDLARINLFAILDELFPRAAVGEASKPPDVGN